METPDPMSTLPPPPPPPPFAARRLRRRTGEGKLGGVCAGIADYLGVDVTLVRLGALVLLLLGPGVPAYLVAWLVIPAAGPDEPRWSPASVTTSDLRLGNRAPQLLGVCLLIGALLIVADDWDWPGHRFLFPLVLIGAGVALLTRTGNLTEPEAPAPAAPTPPGDALAAPPPVPPSAPAPPPTVRSKVTPVALGAGLLWAGLAVLVGVSVETGMAVGIGILGAGLVVGALTGGGRGLVFPAVVLAAGLVGTAVIDVPLRGGVGDRTWLVASIEDAERSPFRLVAGEARLDLSELRPGAERTVEVEATIGLGQLNVALPEGVPVRIDASAGAGGVVAFGQQQDDGIDVDYRLREDDRRGVGTIVLDLRVGAGEIAISR